MKIILDRVKREEKEILYRLLEYSLFEESSNDGNEMNDDAIFEYKYFDSYFTDSDRDAFFVREKETNKLLGFVMINTDCKKCADGRSIAEFMIIPKYRRNKIGPCFIITNQPHQYQSVLIYSPINRTPAILIC